MKKNILFLVLSINISIAFAQWNAQSSGTADYLKSVVSPAAATGFVVNGNTGYLLKTINGGANWNTIGSTGPQLNAIYFASIDTGYAVGVGGIFKTVDGGITWINHLVTTNVSEANIFFPTKTTGYAVTQNSSMDSLITYKTINEGLTWTKTNSMPSPSYVTSIYFTDVMTGSMVVNADGIYRTVNGGASWVPKLNTNAAIQLNAIHFPSSTVGYAVGYDSTFKTADAGATWNPIHAANSYAGNSVFFTTIDTGYAVGGDGFSTGAISKTSDGGLTWTNSLTIPFTFHSVYFFGTSTGYACGESGIIYKIGLSSGVETYSEISRVNVYPNPCTNIFNLSIEDVNNNELYEVSILDLLGNEIKKTKMSSTGLDIDISAQPKGIYFVRLKGKKESISKKIIKE